MSTTSTTSTDTGPEPARVAAVHRPGPNAPATAAGRPRCPGSGRAPLQPAGAGAR